MTILVEKSLLQLKIVDVLQELVCHSKLNLLAVLANELSYVGLIYLFQESLPVTGSPWKCPSKPLTAKWHPSQSTLVIGCESGELFALTVEAEASLKEVRLPSVQKDADTTTQSPLKFLKWANENQLLTLDISGNFTIWNYSRDGEFQPLADYEVKDTPSKMVVLHSALWECFISCTSGFIYQIMQGNSALTEAFQLDKTILDMVSHEEASLCVLTTGGVFSVFRKMRNSDALNGESGLQLVNTVKMSGRSKSIQVVWLNRDLLALTGGDLTIRLWNCTSNDTFVLPMPDSVSDMGFHSGAEHFTTIAYRANSILSAATNLGGVAFWRYSPANPNTNLEDDWSFMGLVGLAGGSLVRSAWCSDMLYIHNGSTLYQIVEQHPCVAYENHVGVVQVSSSVMVIHQGKNHVLFDSPMRIAGVDLCNNHCLVWGDGKVSVFQLGTGPTHSNEKPFAVGNFDCTCTTARLYKTACFCLEGTSIQMRSFQGSLLSTLSFMDSEGSPVLLALSAHYLCAASTNGFVKLWDVSNRDPKLHVSTKDIASHLEKKFTAFRSLRCNSDATCISFTLKEDESKLFIWRTTWNSVESFEVAAEWEGAADEVTLGAHIWDEEEPRIVICQLNGLNRSGLVSIFVPADQQELLVQDVVSLTNTDQLLIGVHLPQFVLLDETAKVVSRDLQSLAGLDDRSDKATRDAILSFSCHLRRGRVEQAYQAVRSFTSPKIWQSLARSCVQLRRPDVGLICLGKLGNARAAAAVRTAHTKYPNQLDAVTAVLAVQLGMMSEAEEMCEHSGCYELLSRMYQSSNRWEAALQLAHTKDRINLKRTYYNYARHLESEGKLELAKEMYEKCQTHHYDVPRMLFEDTAALQDYCTSGQDPEKLRWWAQFLESSGEMDAALEHYARAGDYLSLVRLHCYLGDLERATELAEQSQDPAACFHVARQHESNNNIPDALKFFAQAGAFGNAVRLCKEQELDDQLYRYAMQGDQEEMIEAARYFESPPSSGDRQPHFDRAVMLYSKAGLVDTALDLASRTEQHEAILELARRLDRSSNPASLQRCANYLASHKHYDTAVDLLAMAGKQSEAIEMCLNYNVKLTESLADQLMGSTNGTVNNRLLAQLGEAAQRQGDYQLAAKKFTQAGDKFQAMKALLKSGDTDRIVFFANVSRQADIYILAGNYLQTLDWRLHPEYVKHIVNFYTKAKSPDLLIGFYEACAQAEIDEYRNYDSALNAMREAQKVASKNSDTNQSTKARVLLVKIDFLEQFTRLCNECQADPKKIVQLEGLLKSSSLELGILKPANIYSAVFHLQMEHKMSREALATLNAMKATIPSYMNYLNYESVSQLCSMMNIPPSTYITQAVNDEEENNTEEIRERIMIRER